MSYNNKLEDWIQIGLSKGMFYLLIMQDLEDKEYFPVYYTFYSDVKQYQDNIISESKLKVVEVIKLTKYEDKNGKPSTV